MSRDDDIVERIKAGDSVHVVAEDFDLSHQRVAQIVREQTGTTVVQARGYDLHVDVFKYDDEAIAQRFRDGETARQIADDLGAGYLTVIRSLRRSGLTGCGKKSGGPANPKRPAIEAAILNQPTATIKELAAELDVSEAWVREVGRAIGVRWDDRRSGGGRVR